MKDINQMTPEELRKLADEKEQELDRPIKTGVLKEDLYYRDCDRLKLIDYLDYFFTKREFDKFVSTLAGELTSEDNTIPAGTPFVYYKDDGWYDEINFGAEGLSDAWAKKYLKDIKKV